MPPGMGDAIEALSMGLNNVRKNPLLIAISYVLFLASIPLLIVGGIIAFVLAFIPIIGQLVARLLIAVPVKLLFFGGMVGVAGKAFGGDLSLKDFTAVVKNNAKSLGGAYAIYEAIVFVVGLVVGLVMLFVVFGGSLAVGSVSDPSSGLAAGLGAGIVVMYALALLVILAIAVVFQFLDVAVVLGDHDATGAFTESIRLVREAPLSVLGYSVLRFLLGAAIVLPGVVVAAAGSQVADVLGVVGGLITLLLYPVAFAVVMSYHAAYYGKRLQAS